jgi:hypothetical protein
MESLLIPAALLAFAIVCARMVFRHRARHAFEQRRQLHNDRIRREWDIMQESQKDKDGHCRPPA